jgi:hypothetical protein
MIYQDYAEDVDDSAVEEAIGAVGHMAMRVPQRECMSQCLTALIVMIKSRYGTLTLGFSFLGIICLPISTLPRCGRE